MVHLNKKLTPNCLEVFCKPSGQDRATRESVLKHECYLYISSVVVPKRKRCWKLGKRVCPLVQEPLLRTALWSRCHSNGLPMVQEPLRQAALWSRSPSNGLPVAAGAELTVRTKGCLTRSALLGDTVACWKGLCHYVTMRAEAPSTHPFSFPLSLIK